MYIITYHYPCRVICSLVLFPSLVPLPVVPTSALPCVLTLHRVQLYVFFSRIVLGLLSSSFSPSLWHVVGHTICDNLFYWLEYRVLV
jgi:hypothetical protein